MTDEMTPCDWDDLVGFLVEGTHGAAQACRVSELLSKLSALDTDATAFRLAYKTRKLKLPAAFFDRLGHERERTEAIL
jgi:hypothetical protein